MKSFTSLEQSKKFIIMDYKEKYERSLKIAKDYYKANQKLGDSEENDLLSDIFPELKESEDERIRKELLEHCKNQAKPYIHTGNECPQIQSWIAWLEKQGSEPNWCHHKVDLSNCSEEYCKAYYDGWNNCNMQHSQCKSELDDVVKCLINGMKFYYEDNKEATWGTDKWSMPVKHIIEVLEKQGEQKPADKVEPKFKIGDFIVNDYCMGRIVEITNDAYLLDTGQGIPFSCEHNAHLWTIQDAKDGDVLYSPCLELLWIFKSRDTVYCGCNLNYNDGAFCGEGYIEMPTDAIPATKEQHDTLMKAMTDAGWEFDFEKKELKKISQRMISAEAKEAMYGNPAWSEEDECILFHTINNLKFFKDTISIDPNYAVNIIDIEREIDWLKSLKQRYTWKPSDGQLECLG